MSFGELGPAWSSTIRLSLPSTLFPLFFSLGLLSLYWTVAVAVWLKVYPLNVPGFRSEGFRTT